MRADGYVIIDTKIRDDGMEKGFEKIKTEAGSVADQTKRMADQIKSVFSEMDVSRPIAAAQQKIKDLESQLAATSAEFKIAVSEDDDKGAERLARKMESIYSRLEAARERLAREVEKAAQKQAKAEQKAAEQAAKAAEKEAKAKEKAMQKAYKSATKGARRFGSRLSEILSGALIFNAISSGLRNVTSYFREALKTNEQYRESVGKLKGALLTAFQPIYEYVVPAIVKMVDYLTIGAQAVAQFFATLSGKNVQQMSKNAEQLYNEAKGMDAVAESAEEAKRQLMGFDEINKLSEPKTSATDNKTDTSTIAPVFGEFEEFDISKYEEKIHELITLVSMSLLALGAILTFSGANIPLGIALMAAGAVGLAAEIALNWDAVKQALDGPVGDVVALVSGALLALGAILAFSGANIPLGIGLMSVGAVGLATSIAAKWGTIKGKLQGPIGAVVALVSGALLAVGAILAFSGANSPLGIGLIAAGAVGLASTVAANWNTIKDTLRGPVGGVVALVSGALLALGAILAFSGAGLPLGIGLMAAGAVGLVTTAVLNWNTVRDKVDSVIASIAAILSGASLVLGVLLCLSGAGIPLGLPLIAAGLAGSVASWNLDDNPITRFVKNLANGVIKMINRVVDAINDLFHIKFNGLKIGGQVIIPEINTRLIKIPPVPYLATGAVIPPNDPFMAVLGDQKNGTNIEAPADLIRQILREELANTSDNRTAELLRELISVVENISVGDETIGRAAARYNRRASRAGGY